MILKAFRVFDHFAMDIFHRKKQTQGEKEKLQTKSWKSFQIFPEKTNQQSRQTRPEKHREWSKKSSIRNKINVFMYIDYVVHRNLYIEEKYLLIYYYIYLCCII